MVTYSASQHQNLILSAYPEWFKLYKADKCSTHWFLNIKKYPFPETEIRISSYSDHLLSKVCCKTKLATEIWWPWNYSKGNWMISNEQSCRLSHSGTHLPYDTNRIDVTLWPIGPIGGYTDRLLLFNAFIIYFIPEVLGGPQIFVRIALGLHSHFWTF